MIESQKLISFHIIELDKNNRMFMTWTYPTIDNNTKCLILSKCLLKSQQFNYFRNKNNWIYSTNTEVFETDNLNNVKSFSLVVIAKDLNPDKYLTLGRVLSKCYCKKGSPVDLVELYLSVFTTGKCTTLENGTFVLKNFETSVKIKELINLFGLEIILLYTAILLKKRVVWYHHSSEMLLKWIPSLISLHPHRNPNNYLFPLMSLTKDDLNELKNNNFFLAGFTDSNICSKTDLFDILINFAATEIIISPQAKESLLMSKIHKDIAIFLIQLAENSNLSEKDVIKEISNKTNELLNYVKGLSNTEGKISIDDIKSKNLHPTIEMFLINLSVAENLLC